VPLLQALATCIAGVGSGVLLAGVLTGNVDGAGVLCSAVLCGMLCMLVGGCNTATFNRHSAQRICNSMQQGQNHT
jgi:hypothetical protein